ncbi:MAG: FHA domain-containing protein, partial [Eubacteriales bacterium]|nr:FHA domain-containing protein [Eubacteriales bacterium]
TALGASYLILADVSGSINAKTLEDMRSIIQGVVNSLNKNDTVSITPLAVTINCQPLTNNQETIASQLEAIQTSKEDTNLFGGVVQGLQFLKTNSSAKPRKCLIVISDGMDDLVTGITREEVNKAVEEANIPVFTVAMLDSGSNAKKVEAAKVFSSFSRLSPGGLDIHWGLNETTTDEVIQQLQAVNSRCYAIQFDTADIAPADARQTLSVSLKLTEGAIADEISVDTSAIEPPAEEPTPEPAPVEPAPLPQEGGEAVPQEAPGIPLWAYIAAGAGIIIIIISLLLIKKKKAASAAAAQAAMAEAAAPTTEAPGTVDPDVNAVTEPIPVRRAAVEVVLTRVGISETEQYTVPLEESLIIGRNPAQAQMPFPQDTLLSGAHCRLNYQSGQLYVTDMGSTNGTYLNGVPITATKPLQQDDVILIGSMQLRVSWRSL